MAIKNKKANKVEPITIYGVENAKGERSWANVEIIPGKSIRVFGSKRTGCERTGNLNVFSNAFHCEMRQTIDAWLKTLLQPAKNELGRMRLEIPAADSDEGVIMDWIEEHGGERCWFREITARYEYEDVFEYVNRTFEIGDNAEYLYINYPFYGPVMSITAKTVSVWDSCYKKNKRFNLSQFADKNWDFNQAKAHAAFMNHMD